MSHQRREFVGLFPDNAFEALVTRGEVDVVQPDVSRAGGFTECRRIMLMVSLAFFLLGTILCAVSSTFLFLIFGNAVARMGFGALMMLCYAVLGDLFPPVQRSRWIGMLNIPAGFFAFLGPTLGGWFVDNLSWRHLYWMGAPLIAACSAAASQGARSSQAPNSANQSWRETGRQ